MAKKKLNGNQIVEFEDSLLRPLRPNIKGLLTFRGETGEAANKMYRLLLSTVRNFPDAIAPPTPVNPGELVYLKKSSDRRLIAMILEANTDVMEILALHQELGVGECRNRLVIDSGSVLTLRRGAQETLRKCWTITNDNGTCVIS